MGRDRYIQNHTNGSSSGGFVPWPSIVQQSQSPSVRPSIRSSRQPATSPAALEGALSSQPRSSEERGAWRAADGCFAQKGGRRRRRRGGRGGQVHAGGRRETESKEQRALTAAQRGSKASLGPSISWHSQAVLSIFRRCRRQETLRTPASPGLKCSAGSLSETLQRGRGQRLLRVSGRRGTRAAGRAGQATNLRSLPVPAPDPALGRQSKGRELVLSGLLGRKPEGSSNLEGVGKAFWLMKSWKQWHISAISRE